MRPSSNCPKEIGSRALQTVHNVLLLAWMRIRPKSWPKRFVYLDGAWLRTIRPTIAYRKLRYHPSYSLSIFERAIQDYDEVSIRKIAVSVRYAFSVKFLNQIECLALLATFFMWHKAVHEYHRKPQR